MSTHLLGTYEPYAQWDAERGLYVLDLKREDNYAGWERIVQHPLVIAAFCTENAQYEIVMGMPENFARVRKLAALDQDKDIVAILTIEDRACQ